MKCKNCSHNVKKQYKCYKCKTEICYMCSHKALHVLCKECYMKENKFTYERGVFIFILGMIFLLQILSVQGSQYFAWDVPGPNGNLIMYFPFDAPNASLAFQNNLSIENKGLSNITASVLGIRTNYQNSTGLLVNGTYGEYNNSLNATTNGEKITFDNYNPRIVIGKNFTLEFWMNSVQQAGTDFRTFFVQRDNVPLVKFQMRSNGTLYIPIRDSAGNIEEIYQTIPTMFNGQYHHFALRGKDLVNGSINITLFYDGSQYYSVVFYLPGNPFPTQCLNNAVSFCSLLGGVSGALDTKWSGAMDELRLYNIDLNDSQILATFQANNGTPAIIISPSWNESVGNRTFTISQLPFSWTMNISSTNNFSAFSNESSVSLVTNNVTKTILVTLSSFNNHTFQVWNVSNTDGSQLRYFQFHLVQTNQTNQSNGTSIDTSAIAESINRGIDIFIGLFLVLLVGLLSYFHTWMWCFVFYTLYIYLFIYINQALPHMPLVFHVAILFFYSIILLQKYTQEDEDDD